MRVREQLVRSTGRTRSTRPGVNIAARCGLGAVMGSKKLKAIAVKGSHTINIAHPDKMLKLVDTIFEDYKTCQSWQLY